MPTDKVIEIAVAAIVTFLSALVVKLIETSAGQAQQSDGDNPNVSLHKLLQVMKLGKRGAWVPLLFSVGLNGFFLIKERFNSTAPTWFTVLLILMINWQTYELRSIKTQRITAALWRRIDNVVGKMETIRVLFTRSANLIESDRATSRKKIPAFQRDTDKKVEFLMKAVQELEKNGKELGKVLEGIAELKSMIQLSLHSPEEELADESPTTINRKKSLKSKIPSQQDNVAGSANGEDGALVASEESTA